MATLIWTAILSLSIIHTAAAKQPQIILPKTSLGPEDMAIIVNDNDELSRRIAAYYQVKRGIPDKNLIHVRFTPGESVMSRSEFARVKAEVDKQTPESVQAYALTWAAPYRVDCMSITSAFAFGFDKAYCAHGCAATKASPYFNSPSLAPYHDFKIRPTMALAGTSFESVKELIDRGIAADDTHPPGSGYLLSTDDKSRNVRAALFPAIVKTFGNMINLRLIHGDYIKDKNDVLFYFTGLVKVPGLDSLGFVPGAIADHLTSAGGVLTGSSQMSSLRWLEAGATGSYGAVTEPCNYPQKFPNPALVIGWYLQGESLMEAYWKSVAWPGQGIFIGDPLAKPFAGYSITADGNNIILRTQALPPGDYALLGANSPVGPYRAEAKSVIAHLGMNEFHFRNLNKAVYRLVRMH